MKVYRYRVCACVAVHVSSIENHIRPFCCYLAQSRESPSRAIQVGLFCRRQDKTIVDTRLNHRMRQNYPQTCKDDSELLAPKHTSGARVPEGVRWGGMCIVAVKFKLGFRKPVGVRFMNILCELQFSQQLSCLVAKTRKYQLRSAAFRFFVLPLDVTWNFNYSVIVRDLLIVECCKSEVIFTIQFFRRKIFENKLFIRPSSSANDGLRRALQRQDDIYARVFLVIPFYLCTRTCSSCVSRFVLVACADDNSISFCLFHSISVNAALVSSIPWYCLTYRSVVADIYMCMQSCARTLAARNIKGAILRESRAVMTILICLGWLCHTYLFFFCNICFC